jgi:hypothetical protein
MMEVGRAAAILLQRNEYQFIKYKSFCAIEILICILCKINLNTCFLLEQIIDNKCSGSLSPTQNFEFSQWAPFYSKHILILNVSFMGLLQEEIRVVSFYVHK